MTTEDQTNIQNTTESLSLEEMLPTVEGVKNLWSHGYAELSRLFTNWSPSLLLTLDGAVTRIPMAVGFVKFSKWQGNLQVLISVPLDLLQRDQLEYQKYLESERQQANLYNVDEESTS